LKVLGKIRHGIDTLNEYIGKFAKYILIAILFCLMFEVIARYVFNNPTIWAQDICKQALVALGSLGGGYALLYNQHVRVDVFYGSWSDKTRAIVDICTCALYMLFLVLLVYQTTISCIDSWNFGERMPTVFAPPLYYIKTVIPVGAFLLLLQAISKLIHDIQTVVTGKSEGLKHLD